MMAPRDPGRNVVRGYGPLDGSIARLRHRLAQRMLEGVFPRDRILDIGCGVNAVFLGQIDFAERIGLDKETTPGAAASLLHEGIVLMEHNADREPMLPFETDRFDAVTMLAMLEHVVPDRAALLLTEVYRVLRPGGRLVVTTPAAWTDRLLRTMAGMRLISAEEIDDHKDAYTCRSLRETLIGAGFAPQRVRAGRFELLMNLWATAEK